MAKSDLGIDILGTTITISADEDPEYLRMLLEKYKRTIENVQRISGITDPLKTAVLTGFLLSDDLEKANAGKKEAQNTAEESDEAERLTWNMISRLEELESGSVFKLQNTVKNYDWGSPEWIPSLLKADNPDRVPWAEFWMGVHSAGPSRIIKSAETLLLPEFISMDKETLLGRECAFKYGTLPFLFKIIAAARPLSIQAHPDIEQAREGFGRENDKEIPLDAPNRNYRDSNHKPELLCALSPFMALCGFRKCSEIKTLMEIICTGIYAPGSQGSLKAGIEKLIEALGRENENPIKAFIQALFSIDFSDLGQHIMKSQGLLEKSFGEYQDEWKLCSYLASFYPEDPGVIAPLFLNIIELKPSEAIFIPPGVLHTYIHGMGIELMTNSDNVIRGGLSSKHVDSAELLKVLNFSEYKPEIYKAPQISPAFFSYPVKAEEYVLSVLSCQGTSVQYPEAGPSIVFLTQGDLVITENGREAVTLKTGESAFIPADKNRDLEFSGNFVSYIASCRSW